MKRLITVLLIICTLIIFTACNTLEGIKKDLGFSTDDKIENSNDNQDGDEIPDNNENPDNNNQDMTGDNNSDNTEDNNSGNTGTGSGSGNGSTTHIYTDFTSDEKALMTERIGLVIPFIPNDSYVFEEYVGEDEYEGEYGIYLCTTGNTSAEFEAYLEKFSSYTLTGTEDDEGDTWYYYSKGDVYLDFIYYSYDGDSYLELYAYIIDDTDSGNGGTVTGSKDDTWRETYDCITIDEAYDICDEAGSTKTEERYYLIGTVVSIYTDKDKNGVLYGKMDIEDSTGDLLVYGTYSADGELRYGVLSSAPKVGDVVLFYGNFMNYNGTREMYSGWIIDFYTPTNADSGNTGSGNTGSGSTSTSHTYNDFTSTEKSTMNNILGAVLPFAPNDDYYVESEEDTISFYSFDLTEAEFSAYRAKFSSYTYEGCEADEEYDDIIWHIYTKGDLVVCLSFYYNEDEDWGTYSVLDVYAYLDTESDSGNTGSGSGTGSGNTSTDLPTGVDGVYNVDFTDATNVKDVTDQGWYIDGCPTTGSPAVLVIPVQFSDKLASSSHDLDKLEDAFTKIDPNDDFYSVYEYYYISSYGQLTLDITVIDSWFMPSRNSSYYKNSKDYEGYGNGDMLIMDEAISYLSSIMDLSKFDSDNNGFIDAIILVNTLDIDSDSDFNWAYRYWNYHGDDDGNYYTYDGVSANDYIWASFNFLFESYDSNDNPIYTDTSVMNTYTFIHEFAHVLGVDDYYNYNGDVHPMDGCDVMDSMFGDHNPFSKFNLGWITTSRLVVTDTSVTLTLEAFSKNGDTIIIANNWDEDLGAYQEYYILMYYTCTGLNDNDAGLGYFSRDGVVVYHINAALAAETIDGEIYYDVANNNNSPSSDGSGSEDNLIEFVKSAEDTFTFIEGDTTSTVIDDEGNTLAYTFVVDSLAEDYATITFTAK